MDPSIYEHKRAEFVRELEKSSDEYLQRRLFDAIVSADVCIITYIEFMEAMTSAVSRIQTGKAEAEKVIADRIRDLERVREQNKQDTSIDELLQIAEELEKLEPVEDTILLEEDPEFQELLRGLPSLTDTQERVQQTISLIQAAQQTRNNAFQEMEDYLVSVNALREAFAHFELFVLSMKVEEVSGTLEMIFKSRNKEQATQGAILFAEYIIGLLPVVGDIAATIRVGLDLYKTRIFDTSTTDDQLGYLKTFAASADEWSLTAQIIIDAVSDLSVFESIPLEESQARLRQRKALRVQEFQKS